MLFPLLLFPLLLNLSPLSPNFLLFLLFLPFQLNFPLPLSHSYFLPPLLPLTSLTQLLTPLLFLCPLSSFPPLGPLDILKDPSGSLKIWLFDLTLRDRGFGWCGDIR